MRKITAYIGNEEITSVSGDKNKNIDNVVLATYLHIFQMLKYKKIIKNYRIEVTYGDLPSDKV